MKNWTLAGVVAILYLYQYMETFLDVYCEVLNPYLLQIWEEHQTGKMCQTKS